MLRNQFDYVRVVSLRQFLKGLEVFLGAVVGIAIVVDGWFSSVSMRTTVLSIILERVRY